MRESEIEADCFLVIPLGAAYGHGETTMIADLHRVFVPFHRNSSSFGIQCLVKIYEFADKKEEQRILASMSRTRDSVLQFRPVITSSLFFSTCSVSSTAKC